MIHTMLHLMLMTALVACPVLCRTGDCALEDRPVVDESSCRRHTQADTCHAAGPQHDPCHHLCDHTEMGDHAEQPNCPPSNHTLCGESPSDLCRHGESPCDGCPHDESTCEYCQCICGGAVEEHDDASAARTAMQSVIVRHDQIVAAGQVFADRLFRQHGRPTFSHPGSVTPGRSLRVLHESFLF